MKCLYYIFLIGSLVQIQGRRVFLLKKEKKTFYRPTHGPPGRALDDGIKNEGLTRQELTYNIFL